MKSSRNRAFLAAGAVVAITFSLAAHAGLPAWMQSVTSGSAIESALYRAMDLPGIRTLYERPPAEARTQLTKLVAAKPDAAQLYPLRAHVEEQALDFTAAEQDWKRFAAHAQNKTSALFQLADYYHRRNLGPQEIAALESATASPSPASEQFLAADRQQAWQAFPRALQVAHDQALGDDATISIYQAWIARYPTEPAARANFIAGLLAMHRYADAQQAIDAYHAAFPNDTVLPIKAAALLALDENTPDAIQHALTLFDNAYQPLWPDDLIKTYFNLLDGTHTSHAMLANARAQLRHNPDDLIAATKIFDYYQQQGHQDAAIDTITQYAAGKDAHHATWSPDELYTFATLLERDAQPQQAARFYLALSSAQGHLSATKQSTQVAGLSGLIRLLLTSSDQPIDLGSGNLSLYRDIATLDPGPGYLNGILSLWLNSQSPSAEFQSEEQKATPYFHRAKAAELLTLLDQRFPALTERPALHAQLIQAYIAYGQDDAIKRAAQQFLTEFPTAPQHLQVALELADADARTNDTQAEFALYDKLLTELATQLKGMPLTAAGPASSDGTAPLPSDDSDTPASSPTPAGLLQQSLTLVVAPPPTTAAAEAYRQVLDRYLGRLTTTGQVPAALIVLRRELDRNPNDPLLYERLAQFLQQNNLAAQEEAVYRQALARFNNATFYDKLARFYIRHQRDQDFDTLSRKVVDIFHGTELENYFSAAGSSHPKDPLWPREYLELNLYAHQRFPHDLAFTRNLLFAYQQPGTADPKAYDLLLREHFQEASDLQTEFFADLASHHQLDAELAALKALVPTAVAQQQDPDATHELAEIYLWQSHFEQSAPLLGELAQAYPANTDIGEQAASVYRSLAYFDPAEIPRAVAIEQHLSVADPANLERLAIIGDIYANSTDTSLNLDTAQQLNQARPFWLQMTAIHPGLHDGYLQSATVFWNYFQFDDALAQIEAARKHFHNPALYGYQAGAIDENKRDYPQAIAEYVAASISTDRLSADGSDDASARLLTLASRPEFASLVDQATVKSVANNPSIPALTLRLSILTALHRQSNIAPLVVSAIARAQTVAQLSALEDFSQSNQLPTAYQAALRRQIALTTDPVQRIEFQYQLVHSLVTQKDIADAQTIITAVHATNPELVGVVRTTTDFYWNNKQPQRAIATLLQAAHQANPTLAHDFTLEAIAKSNQSGDYTGARTLLQPLLAADPFSPQYLSLDAESYSLAHDNAGVRDLYTNTLATLKTAPISAADRRNKIALARQGLIPALTGLNDFAGAMDQHIALIRSFPEDDSILQNAVAYARLHSREAQLVTFLNQAVAASPRDSRFAIDVGEVDVLFDNPTGALAAYSRAIAIRSDRTDLFIARADLEERAQNFDAACEDYERLYKLTYNNLQWLENVAELRARQGKPDLAAKALQTAWIDGRPASAQNEFLVAQKLEAWNLLPQANTYARQGVQLAGKDLLTNAADNEGAVLYARLLARQRKSAEAFAFFNRVLAASNTSPSAPSVVLQQVEKQGITSVTDSDWRKALVAMRMAQAQTTYRNAVQAIAAVVAEFYTPEEKSAFATLLDAQRANSSDQDVVHLWIPAARTAHLEDREAAWQRDILLHGGKLASSQFESFCTLETARMDDRTLAQTLDAYAQQLPAERQPDVLTRAVTAWHNAGDPQQEAIDLRELVLAHQQQYYEQRLFTLYLNGDPNALMELTKQAAPLGDAAANYVLAHATQSQSYQALANRAVARTAVWSTAHTALLGLYENDISAKTDTAFQSTLGDLTIGNALASKPDATKQLVGQPWFYYATRYGFFLTLTPHPTHNPEDYLAAVLEQAPTDPNSYKTLAKTYLDAHQVDAAILEYRHATELDPADASPNIAIAEALWSNQRQPQALLEWTTALTKLLARVNQQDVPESFWTNFAVVANDAAKDHLGPQLKPSMTLVLTTYIRKNGTYRSTELLQSAFHALAKPNPADATDWLLSLIHAAPASNDRLTMISGLTDTTWLPKDQWGAIYRAEISLAKSQQQAHSSDTTTGDSLDQLIQYKTKYIQWLLDNNRAAEAQTVFDAIPLSQRSTTGLQPEAILLAAKQSHIPALLASYQSHPTQAPDLTILISAANTLQQEHDLANSRLLLEYVFQQRLEQQTLTAPDYLSLAEARIDTNDLPGALDLLHRLTLSGDFYDNLDSAASLLERTNHFAEALPLLTTLAHGTPWNAQYQLRLAKAQLTLQQTAPASTALTAITANGQTSYDTRAAAAIALHTISHTSHFDSEELTLLATTTPTPQQANQPYFLYARIEAATAAPATQHAALLRAAIAIAPSSMLNWLRFHLFQSELTLNHDAQAAVAIDPILNTDSALFLASSTNNPPSAATNSYDLANVFSTDADKQTFHLSVTTMYEHLNNKQQAIQHLQSAKQLTTDPTKIAALTQRIRTLQASIDLVQQNALRRPILQPSVDQPNIVRPRLIAGATTEVNP